MIEYVDSYINDVCKKYARNQDKEDIHSEAWCAILEAKKNYHNYRHMYSFESFAEYYIKAYITDYKKQINGRFSSISLDKSYCNSQEPLLQIIPSGDISFENYIELKSYLYELGEVKYHICIDIINNYTEQEILERNNISKYEFQKIKNQLKNDLSPLWTS